MKKRRVKVWVLPTLYVLVIGVLFVSISYLGSILATNISGDIDMSVSAIEEEEITPVIKEENTEDTSIIVKPYTSTKVSISKSFYDMQDDEATQQKSLIYYEETYMQNSGVLYTSSEEFDVLSTYDGKVTKIETDEILGNYIEITHNTNLKTIYYSLKDVTVTENQEVKSGEVIAKSGTNLLNSESDYNLLFEVYYNGLAIDPEDFYNMSIDELN